MLNELAFRRRFFICQLCCCCCCFSFRSGLSASQPCWCLVRLHYFVYQLCPFILIKATGKAALHLEFILIYLDERIIMCPACQKIFQCIFHACFSNYVKDMTCDFTSLKHLPFQFIFVGNILPLYVRVVIPPSTGMYIVNWLFGT